MSLDRRRLLAAGLAATALPGLARAGEAELEALNLEVMLKHSGAPALTGALVTADGVKRVWAAGVRKLGGTDAATEMDLWHIGSNTKAMTAALYGRYVEMGRARWDAPVSALFPDVKLDGGWKSVTVEDLMSHRAGISDQPIVAGGWLMRGHSDKRELAVQRTELAATVFGKPPHHAPGAFEYSNIGYILVGAAIERIARTSWENAISTDLFAPLGMTTAGFGAPRGPSPWGHAFVAGKLIPVDPAGLSDNPPVLGPAGRVHLRMGDYGRFIGLFLTRGNGFLKPETITRLTTVRPGPGTPYALGWMVATPPGASAPVLAHEGSNTLWHAAALVNPSAGHAAITACNASPEGSGRVAANLAMGIGKAAG